MLAVYLGYVFMGLLLCILVMTGRLRIRGANNIPFPDRSILFVVNHPSLRETIIMVGILFWKYLWNLARWNIWSTPDQNNFCAHGFWGLFRERFIPIPRELGKKDHRLLFRALLVIARVLRQAAQIVILFPEGGRTFTGKKFVHSKSGQRMATLGPGVGAIIRQSGNVWIIPVRVGCTEDRKTDGVTFLVIFGRIFWPMTVTFGKPFLADATYRAHDRDWITLDVQRRMLETADMAEI